MQRHGLAGSSLVQRRLPDTQHRRRGILARVQVDAWILPAGMQMRVKVGR